MQKRYRLSGEEIRALKGSRMHGAFFSVLVAPIGGTLPKCACVASKKVSLKAPVRNLIKRRCRAALAKSIMTIKKPLAVVFHAKREAAEASFADIQTDIISVVSRIAVQTGTRS
jgi:ribonuclease P protein component